MHPIIDRIDLKGRNNKRGTRSQSFWWPLTAWLCTVRDVIITDHLVLWIFIISLHTRPPLPIQHQHPFTHCSFSKEISLKKKKKKKSRVRVQLFTLHTKPEWQMHWEELKCTFRSPEPKYYTPGSLNKEQGRGSKSSSRGRWQTNTPTINERMASLLADSASSYLSNHTSASSQNRRCLCLTLKLTATPWTGASRTSKRLFTFISQMFITADPLGTTPCSHLPTPDLSHIIAWEQENCRKSMHPGRGRWLSPSLTQFQKVFFPLKLKKLLYFSRSERKDRAPWFYRVKSQRTAKVTKPWVVHKILL